MQEALDRAVLKDQRSDIKHAVLSVDVCRKQSETFCVIEYTVSLVITLTAYNFMLQLFILCKC